MTAQRHPTIGNPLGGSVPRYLLWQMTPEQQTDLAILIETKDLV